MTERLANLAESTLAVAIDADDTAVVVQTGEGAEFPAAGDFRLVVADGTNTELMLATARSGDDITVTRGIEGTSGHSFGTGAVVAAVLTAAGLETFIDEEIASVAPAAHDHDESDLVPDTIFIEEYAKLTGAQTITTTGTVNDQTLNDVGVFHYNGAGSLSLRGFTGGADGRILIVVNDNSAAGNVLTLIDENVNATAANRLALPNGSNQAVRGRGAVVLVYNATISRWQMLSGSLPSTGAGANVTVDAAGTAGTAGTVPSANGHGHQLVTYSSPPPIAGTASAGTSGDAPSRGSHKHPGGSDADFALSGDISPTTLSANTDDWAPTGLSTAAVIRASTDASRTLNGLTGGADGRMILLANVGANDLVLKHENTSSTAANRFYCPNSTDFTLRANEAVQLIYDATSSRWRVVESRVQGADLVLTDVTTNDVSTSKHGFAPKAPNDATKFLDGTGAWDTVKDADLSTSDVTTNDVSTSKHGFAPKAPNDATKVLLGDASWGYPDTIAEDFFLSGDISPSQITSDQNDYNPTNLATSSVLRLSTDATRSLTGLQGGADGRAVFLMNVGTQRIMLRHDSSSSTAGNRFYCPGSHEYMLAPGSHVMLLYDSTSSRWRVMANVPGGWDIYKTAMTDETVTNSSSLVDSTYLQFAHGGSGERWEVELAVLTAASNTTGDIDVEFLTTGTWSTGTGRSFVERGFHWADTGAFTALTAGAVPASTTTILAAASAFGGIPVNNGDTQTRMLFLRLILEMTAAGTAKIAYANSSAASGRTSTIVAGSTLKARRLTPV